MVVYRRRVNWGRAKYARGPYSDVGARVRRQTLGHGGAEVVRLGHEWERIRMEVCHIVHESALHM